MELLIVPCLAAPLWEKKKESVRAKQSKGGGGRKLEIRDVNGTSHTLAKGCRELPEPSATDWKGRGLGLGQSPFPEAVAWGRPWT